MNRRRFLGAIGRLLCRCGLHRWEEFHVELLGPVFVCQRCGLESILDPSEKRKAFARQLGVKV